MYNKSFYITSSVGNNVFSYEERENKKLYVPSLIENATFDQIELGNEIVFEDFNFTGVLQGYTGLKNFYELEIQRSNFLINPPLTPPLRLKEEDNNVKIYLFDNHNHAFYFWALVKSKGIINDQALLYHIDEHADTRIPEKLFNKDYLSDLQKVFDYTNYELNVGNYIIPAQKCGLIGEVVQIRSSYDLEEYLNRERFNRSLQKTVGNDGIVPDIVPIFVPENIILNLDLDFFQKDLDFIDYDLKKKVILDIASKASVITVCTSPFFIEQQRALDVFFDIFK